MKRILSFIGMMAVGAVSVLAADSMIRGYTFDGATGLKTGAMLEDLVTQSMFTQAAGLTNNTTRHLDGDTLWTTNGVFGAGTNYVATVKTNSITGGHIRDGTITSADVLDGSLTRSDFEPGSLDPSVSNIYAFAVYMTRATFALPTGWSYTNVPVFEGTNYDYTGGGCLASNRFFVPVSGLWHFEGGMYDDDQASSYDLTAAITTNFNGVGDFIGIGPIAATNSAAGDLCSPVQCEFYLPAGTAVSLAAFNGSLSPKTIGSVLNLRIEKPYLRGHLIAR